MKKWTRNDTLSGLIAERGLLTTGFKESLYWLVKEQFADMSNEELSELDDTVEEAIDYMYKDHFSDFHCVPAAHQIVRHPDGPAEIHAYEVEGSARISRYKLAQYGDLADRNPSDYPVYLHIVDRAGRETIIDPDQLMRLSIICYDGNKEHEEYQNMVMRDVLRGATREALATPVIQSNKTEERAILRAVYELGLIQPGEVK